MSSKTKIPTSQIVNDYLNKEKVIFSKYMLLLSGVLFSLFGFVDWIYLGEFTHKAIVIRAYTISYIVLVSFIPFFKPAVFLKHYFKIMLVSFMVSAISIQLIINISSPDDLAKSIYFAGLMLTIMSLFTWTFIKVQEAIFITFMILVLYISSAYYYAEVRNINVLIYNLGSLLFLVSSAVIGLMSSLMRNKYLNYGSKLQGELRQALLYQEKETKKQKELARQDDLTGLPNRRGAMSLLKNMFKIAKEKNEVVVVCFLDLNGFKQVNDTFGHNVGDEILKISASRIASSLRNIDLLSRLSGDEFLIAIRIEESKLEIVDVIFANIKSTVSKPMRTSKGLINQSISLGSAVFPFHGNTVDAVIEIADKRMYKDKDSSKHSKNVELSIIEDIKMINDDKVIKMRLS